MARRLHQLICLAFFAAGFSTLFAQDPAATQKASPPAPSPADKSWKKLDRFEEGRRIFEQMSPEQRQRLRENIERWQNMPPEERDAMRDREHIRREKIAQEIDETLKKSGLQLDADRREVFALRYAQERRKIEEGLRKEMEAKRRPMMQEMMERLKKEFSPFNNASASPSPTASSAGAAASPSARP